MWGDSDARLAGALIALSAGLGSGCTLTRADVTECSSNGRCRDVFGPGSICNSDGLCERAPPRPRCALTYPDDLMSRPDRHRDTIIVGNLMDRSVLTQQGRENAVRLAAMQVNEKLGLAGRPVGVVFCDISQSSKYDPLSRTDAAIDSALYLSDVIGAPAIVGPSSSTDTLEVFTRLAKRDVLLISPAATSPALTQVEPPASDGQPGMLWRTAPPDTIQGQAIAEYLSQLSPLVTGVDVIAEAGPYGEQLATVFQQSFQGPKNTVNVSVFGSTSERDAAVVTAGKTSSQWVLFISSQTPDAAAFLNAAATISGYATKSLFLTDSAANTDLLIDAAGAASLFPKVHGSRPSVPQGAVYEQFRASFTAAFKKDANDFSFVAHAYDAAWLVLYGSARSLGQENAIFGRGIARGLRRVSSGPAANVDPSTWPLVAGELANGGSVDVTGASGKLDFNPVTEETRGPTDIWKISADGKSIVVELTIQP